jgi:hypothetical protein
MILFGAKRSQQFELLVYDTIRGEEITTVRFGEGKTLREKQ